MSLGNWNDLDEALISLKKIGIEITPSKEKVVKKILNLVDYALLDRPFNLETIMHIDLDQFSEIKTVGKSYVKSLSLLKRELAELNSQSLDIFECSNFDELFSLVPELNKDLYLIQKGLDEKEIKLLKSLTKNFGEPTVENLLKLYRTKNAVFHEITKNRLNSIKNLLNKIKTEIESRVQKGAGFIPGDSELIASNKDIFFNYDSFEDFLIEDVEDFIFNLDERRQDIILSRTGYNHSLSTLEELGSAYECTRERIRQIESNVFANLRSSLRVHVSLAKKYIVKHSEDEDLGLPVVSTFFDSKIFFYAFIELLIGADDDINSKLLEPVTNKYLFNDFISLNVEPYTKSQLINELISNYGMHIVKASRTLDYLVEEKVFQNDFDQYKPIHLRKKEALSQVLLGFPEGLPWKDVINIVNAKGYTSSPMTLLRLDYAFAASEYIYQSDHGTYRHIQYSVFEDFDIDSLLIEVNSYLKKLHSNTSHLMEFYSKAKGNLGNISYFEVRHLVREYGDLYGIYFNGKSNQDSISLNKELKPGGQRNMIINELNEAVGPLSKLEITNLLRSKSDKHASFYLNELILDKRVIKIEDMQYTTPNKAFKDVNVQEVLNKIREIVFSTNLPVEADVFRQRLNAEFGFSYSKHFYISLAFINLESLNAYKRRSFLSRNEISFDGLSDLSRKTCLKSLSYEENIARLRRVAVLTDAVAYNAVFRGI